MAIKKEKVESVAQETTEVTEKRIVAAEEKSSQAKPVVTNPADVKVVKASSQQSQSSVSPTSVGLSAKKEKEDKDDDEVGQKKVTFKELREQQRKKKNIVWSDIKRFNPDVKRGLSREQVAKRQDEALNNKMTQKRGKTILQIYLSNIFTFFNVLYIFIAVVLAVCGQWTQLSFLAIVIANTAIAIFQEIKSKKSLDKLRIAHAPQAIVLRDGVRQKIPAEEVVLDDIVEFSNGGSICADSIVVSGGVEVNESMLTGESDNVTKNAGDILYAGSYVTAGICLARVDKVAEYNYIENLTQKASRYQKPRSQMLMSLKLVLRVVAVIIICMSIFLFKSAYDAAAVDTSLTQKEVVVIAVTKTAASILGMIPAGPFLLTTVALAVSVLNLAKKRTMVQELYCIEMLARVDVLCLDKTGTLTDGTMEVIDVTDLSFGSKYAIRDVISSMNNALKDSNMTSVALNNYFGEKSVLRPTEILPFNSKRKFSAVSFGEEGTYFLGAPEFVLTGKQQKVESLTQKYAEKGYRVLLLAHASGEIVKGAKGDVKLPVSRRPVALIAIEDHIRPDAPETIKWFVDNGVGIKIISGDNPSTVSCIAKKVGVPFCERYVSLEGMSEQEIRLIAPAYTVFGRVTPEQKAILVKELRAEGKTVAMTGDGVNDILAMRESDCAIAMGSGSEAAFNASHLVLLDNDFANMPNVVAEGRKVVNNIQASSSMYFMKILYNIMINALVLIGAAMGMKVSYPFDPTNILLLEFAVIGLPSIILALQPNKEQIKGNFLSNIIRKCLPAALTFTFVTVSLYFICQKGESWFGVELPHFSTIAAVTLTLSAIIALYVACLPLSNLRVCALAVCIIITAIGLSFNWAREFLRFDNLNGVEILLVITATALSFFLMYGCEKFFSWREKCSKQRY